MGHNKRTRGRHLDLQDTMGAHVLGMKSLHTALQCLRAWSVAKGTPADSWLTKCSEDAPLWQSIMDELREL